MTDQNIFMEVLREVGEIMKTSEDILSEEEVMSYFADMDLNDGQKKLILDYLNNLPGNGADRMEAEDGQSGIDESSEGSKVLRAYMEDLSLLKTYSEEEKIELYKQLFNGDRDVIEIISAVWLDKVLNIAKKYMDIHSKVEDLIQEGNIALLEKLNEFCGTKDVMELETIEQILSESVERNIMEYISEWNGVKEQENVLVGKLSLIHEAGRYLEGLNGAPPTIGELADYTKMSVEELSDYTEYLNNIK